MSTVAQAERQARTPAPETEQVGVYVLGMHRSGTSAVTELVRLLGVSTCSESDLVPAAPANPRGHWESATLVRLNDELLAGIGRAWWCPPRLGVVWQGDHDSARETFAAVHRSDQWVWKDPRSCLTLPFWLDALESRPVVVLTIRNPLEVSKSLERRNNFFPRLSLGLWERYLHHAVAAIAGLPTVIVRYEDLTAEPVATSERIHGFLVEHGVAARIPEESAIRASINRGLRHNCCDEGELVATGVLSEQQLELASVLAALPGASASFTLPALPVETPSTDRLFSRLQLDHGLRGSSARPRRPRVRASVIVTTRSEGRQLRTTVDSLLETLPRDAELVVVDDGSTDDSTSFLAATDRARLITSRSRLGVARARNLGASVARGDILVFSDAHVMPACGWLPPLLAELQRGEVAAAAPTLSDMRTGQVRVHGLRFVDAALNVGWGRVEGWEPQPTPLVCGCFVAVRADSFQRAGAFDDGFERYGAEDLELSLRLWRLGHECVVVPTSEVRHRWRRRASADLDWHSVLANVIRLAMLHLSPDNLERFMACVSPHAAFPGAYAAVMASDALRRRRELERLCPYDDEWFFRRFEMNVFGPKEGH